MLREDRRCSFDTGTFLYEYSTESCTKHVSACPICHQVRPQESVTSDINRRTSHLALRYKSEGRWFDSRWCQWNFSLAQFFRPHCGPEVDSYTIMVPTNATSTLQLVYIHSDLLYISADDLAMFRDVKYKGWIC